jgi:hypothetical protein
MTKLDELAVDKAIELYYEKHHALRHGDLMKLIELKKHYPILFDPAKDREIGDMITYAKEFQNTARYHELCRLLVKDSLSIIPGEKD